MTRSAITRDIDKLMQVMDAAFDPQFGEAWNRRQIEDALMIGRCQYLLVDGAGGRPAHDAPAAGFWLSRTGFDEEELLLFAVAPQFRRKGLGRILLDELFRSASARGVSRIFLEMRANNPADSLYRNCGFLPVGRRKDYYRTSDGNRLDAITFSKTV